MFASYISLKKCKPIVIACFFWLSIPLIGGAKDVSGIYSDATLNHWKVIFEAYVHSTVDVNIEPRLKLPADKQLLQNIRIELPIKTASNDPFYYQYDPKTQVLTIPVLSIKFLYDLLASFAWLQTNGFENSTLLYVNALKYRDASAFPSGRYLSPFEAFAIPHTDDMEISFPRLADKLLFEEYFNSAFLFVVAHEIGHALYPETKQGFKEKPASLREAYADSFAVRIVAGDNFTLVGVEALFQFLGVWSQNQADFSTIQDYEDWLQTASHGTVGVRLQGLGKQMAERPHDFVPDASDSDPKIASTKLTGQQLIEAGNSILNIESRRELRALGRHFDIASLAVHKKSGPSTSLSDEKPLPEGYDKKIAPPRKLSDLPDATDLVKLSASWWGQSLDTFPKIVGLKAGQYQAGADPVSEGFKVIIPQQSAHLEKWAPAELEPFAFRFKNSGGLVEITGFLGKQTESGLFEILLNRYGEPTRIMKALTFVTYVWEYDRSVLELNFMSFKIYPSDESQR